MLQSYFGSLHAGNRLRVSESWLQLDANWIVDPGELSATIATATAHAGSIPARDRFEFIFDAGEERLSIQSARDARGTEAERLVQAAEHVDEVEVSLTIRKRIDGNCGSIYCIDRFAEYLSASPLPAAFRPISGAIATGVRFEVFGELPTSFGTASIRFHPVGLALDVEDLTSKAVRQERLQAFHTNTNASGLPSADVLPSDFHLLTKSGIPEIDEFFDRASAALSIAFLANTSELREPAAISYKFYGYKAIVCSDVAVAELSGSASTLYSLYAWAYEGGSPADKLGLIRNVVSIHLDAKGLPKFDQEVVDAVNSNYQIYLKGNIQSYLEIKNKIAELLLDSVERTARSADEVLDSFKNNVFIVATFLLTVVVINGVKDTNFAAVFSGPYLLLVVFLALCSLLWLFLVRGDAFKRYKSSAETMESLLRSNYRQFLMGAELDGVLTPTLARNLTALKQRVRTYTTWWLVLLTLLVAMFILGNRLFSADPSRTPPSSTGQSDKKKGSALEEAMGSDPAASVASTPSVTKQSNQKGESSAKDRGAAQHAPQKQQLIPREAPNGY